MIREGDAIGVGVGVGVGDGDGVRYGRGLLDGDCDCGVCEGSCAVEASVKESGSRGVWVNCSELDDGTAYRNRREVSKARVIERSWEL